MPTRRRKHWIFLGDFEDHSVREVYCGAAEYVASRPGLDLIPWSEYPGRGIPPTRTDLRRADGLFLADVDLTLLGRGAASLRLPCITYCLSPSVRVEGLAATYMDNHAVGRMAAEHLLARGYRQLAYFGLPGMEWSKVRLAGFREAAEEAGVCIVFHENLPTGSQVNRPPRWWPRERSWGTALQTLPRPCGVFAGCDIGACYLIRTAREMGLRIPEELGIIGVDNNPIASAEAGLAISTIELPFREAGKRTAAMLDQLTHGKKLARSTPILPVRVIARTSTDAFMVSDPLVRRALQMIEERRMEAPTVEQIVRDLHTTPVTLGRHFMEYLKVTPAKHILQRRIEYAKDLLRAGQLTVAQVSDACGFHDCSYFGQVFKRITGTTPSFWQPNHPDRAPAKIP